MLQTVRHIVIGEIVQALDADNTTGKGVDLEP
jgi:hypothetical protein